jgi:predicted secreted hydrolase
MDTELKREFERINKKLNSLAGEKKDEKWVSAYWIIEATGWDENKLQIARRQKLITFRRKGKQGVEYLLSSIPDQFLIKKQTA